MISGQQKLPIHLIEKFVCLSGLFKALNTLLSNMCMTLGLLDRNINFDLDVRACQKIRMTP